MHHISHDLATSPLTAEYKTYLDELRESGEINMFGATPYLQNEFGLDKKEARAVMLAWFESFK
jgi:hypothetical protein